MVLHRMQTEAMEGEALLDDKTPLVKQNAVGSLRECGGAKTAADGVACGYELSISCAFMSATSSLTQAPWQAANAIRCLARSRLRRLQCHAVVGDICPRRDFGDIKVA